jgi:hypothetical protein
MVLVEAHEGIARGHYAGKSTTQKVLHTGLWWPTIHKDAKEYFQNCDVCQRVGNPTGGMRFKDCVGINFYKL